MYDQLDCIFLMRGHKELLLTKQKQTMLTLTEEYRIWPSNVRAN